LRDDLLQRYGVSVLGSYLGQFTANPSGRQEQGESYKGDLGLGLFLDLKRLISWKGGYFATSFSFKNAGKSLSSDYIDNQFGVQVSGRDDDGAARLVHLALGQVFWNDKAELVAGRLLTGDDFATVPLACTSGIRPFAATPSPPIRASPFPPIPPPSGAPASRSELWKSEILS
jgi:carbohydrate-selective porin OprB